MNFLSASFLMFISSIRDSSEAVNQSGLVVIESSAASLAASTTWLSKMLREREKIFSSLYRKIFYPCYNSGGTVVEYMTLYVRVLGLKLTC